ncbi:cold-shock protein [Winogradskyella sp.]|uniref:cold-shock protein n=1 Tax=Winogradskyella sp. TaxID=1883156 RepID=UPI003F6BAA30
MLDFIKRLFNPKKTMGKHEGTVKFFSYKKGFGFIKLDDSDEEIFVHASDLIDKIRDNNHVIFNIEASDKGPIAVNVRRVAKK